MAYLRSWRASWRGLFVGVVVGSLLGAGAAVATDIDMHTAAYWRHGMKADVDNDAHPTLDSTDGTHRQGSAAYLICSNQSHSSQAEYIHSHVHKESSIDYFLTEAHIGSQQTGLAHHDHFDC